MIFLGDRRIKQRHNPIAYVLVHGVLIAVHGLYDAFEDGIMDGPGFLGKAKGTPMTTHVTTGLRHAMRSSGTVGSGKWISRR